MSQDKKLVEIVKDDDPGKEIETAYDRETKGPMSGRMKQPIMGEPRESDCGGYGY